jgi:SAM-dependent methyltransferase
LIDQSINSDILALRRFVKTRIGGIQGDFQVLAGVESAVKREAGAVEAGGDGPHPRKSDPHAAMAREAWAHDVRMRNRTGRPDSGVKLYVTDRDANGAREFMANSRFQRYPGLWAALVQWIGETPAERPYRILMTPASVGIEAAGFAIALKDAGLYRRRDIVIESFDISAKATALARTGIYPRALFPADLSPFADCLAEEGDGFVRVSDEVRRLVRILAPSDLLDFKAAASYDLVVCLNLLMHLGEADRPAAVRKLAELTTPGGLLCINNNFDWPQALEPHFLMLTGSRGTQPVAGGGEFSSLHERFAGNWPQNADAPFAVTDARAMILGRNRR